MVLSLNEDDLQRNSYYEQNNARSGLQSNFSDYGEFLKSLEMDAEIKPFCPVYMDRITQLTNKTNQFNLNGQRVTDEEVGAALASGGRLFTATLEDKTGSHGEILAALITGEGRMISFVLSCRVFQRRVEHAFSA